jgi:hypothetical protein
MLVDYNGFKIKDIIPEKYIKDVLPEMYKYIDLN